MVAAGVLLRDRLGAPGFDRGRQRLRRQRLRRPFAGQIQPGRRPGHRDRHDRVLPDRDHGGDRRRAPKGFAPLAIGLALTLIHLISIPVTNTSVNPARSTGPAPVRRRLGAGQLWLFWVAPLAGAAIAGIGYRFVVGDSGSEPVAEEAQESGAADVSIGELTTPDVGGREPPR